MSNTVPTSNLARATELMPAVGLTGVIVMMVLPVPAFILDLSLVMSIALSLTILIVSLYVKEALDFAAFPTVLLFSTLLRLSLNVASTRLILLRGEEGTAAAGHVIEAFGQFVVAGNYAVGFIVFAILVIINFVVITKGATRIAEVAARFTLDAMPGKQMAIDADLNAGLINESEARQRRLRTQKEADFYGAMDGASKFVRGDAVAGLIILAVNLLGGFFVGVMQKGMTAGDAAQLYSLLSIGDGLVSQIPALIVSTAAGMVVTRTSSGGELGVEIVKQLLWNPRALAVVAVVLALFIFVPGFPAIPFFLAAAAVGGAAYYMAQQDGLEPLEAIAETNPAGEKADEPARPQSVDLIELEVGYELIPLVDSEHGAVVERIRALRRQFVSDRGFRRAADSYPRQSSFDQQAIRNFDQGCRGRQGRAKALPVIGHERQRRGPQRQRLARRSDPRTGVRSAGAVDFHQRPGASGNIGLHGGRPGDGADHAYLRIGQTLRALNY